jgi:hypothetical protein
MRRRTVLESSHGIHDGGVDEAGDDVLWDVGEREGEPVGQRPIDLRPLLAVVQQTVREQHW